MTVVGDWNLTINAGPTPETATLTFAEDAGAVRGRMSSRQGAGELLDVDVAGQRVTFKVAITQPLPMTLEFTGTIDDTDMFGEVKLGAFGTGTWTATRA